MDPCETVFRPMGLTYSSRDRVSNVVATPPATLDAFQGARYGYEGGGEGPYRHWTATTSHGSKRPFRLTVRGSEWHRTPRGSDGLRAHEDLVALREPPDPGSGVDALAAPVETFLGGFGSVESDPYRR